LTSSAEEAEELHLHPQALPEGTPAEEIYYALFVSHLPETWVTMAINKPEIYGAAGEVIRWIMKVKCGRAFFLSH